MVAMLKVSFLILFVLLKLLQVFNGKESVSHEIGWSWMILVVINALD